MKLMNDPIELITKVVNRRHPDLDIVIYFGQEHTDGENTFGVTFFPDDGTKPVIEVNPFVPLAHIAEIIAHEVAHAVVGHGEGHGEVWEQCFEQLSNDFHAEVTG